MWPLYSGILLEDDDKRWRGGLERLGREWLREYSLARTENIIVLCVNISGLQDHSGGKALQC